MLWGFIKKEIVQLLRNKVLMWAVLIMPLVQVIIISLALSFEAKNLKIAIDCKANDYIMQEIREKMEASGWFNKVEPLKETSFRALQMGKIDAVLIAPEKGVTHSIGNFAPRAQLLIDATNVLKAQAIEGYVKAIASSVLQKNKLSCPMIAPNVVFKTRLLFNPEMNSTFFLYPFLMAIIIMITVLTLISISITREKENGTIETLISAPIKNYHIIIGKSVPYIGIGLINLLMMQFIGKIVFHLPFRGNFALFILLFFVFSFTIAAFAILLSTFCETQQQALMALMTFLFLSIMLSGGMGSIENMPLALQFFANLLPLSHYTSLLRNMILKGTDLQYFTIHTMAIFIFGLVTSLIAFKKFKTTL